MERLWKSSKLHVHCFHPTELLFSYSIQIKDARTTYFSHVVTTSKNNHRGSLETMDEPDSAALPAFLDCTNMFIILSVKLRI